MNSNEFNNDKLIEALLEMKEDNSLKNTGTFLNVLLNTKLLLPIGLDDDASINDDGSISFQEEAKIKFKSVINTDNEGYLITFTDWSELKSWDQSCKAVILNYFDILEIVLGEDDVYSGFVINPFSHNHVLTKKAIDAINNAIKK